MWERVSPGGRLWWLRYRIQRVFGLECEWMAVPRGDHYVARCRWCGAYLRNVLDTRPPAA